MDTIKGLALIASFIGVLITFAMWVSLDIETIRAEAGKMMM